jgi:hypothetical protein
MKDRKATALLIGAYGIGQGSVFVLLFATRQYVDAASAGILVLVLSIVSLAQQFGEIGNSPLLVHKVSSKDMADALAQLRTRSFAGFCILLLFCIWTYSILEREISYVVAPVLLCAPLLALLFGLNSSFLFETNRQYTTMALVSIRLWAIITGCLTLGVITGSYTLVSVILLMAITLHLTNIASRNYAFRLREIWTIEKMDRIFGSQILPTIFSSIAGQVWYRSQILLIANNSGLAELAALGIVRSVQVSLILAIGFTVRPILQRKLTEATFENSPITLANLIFNLRLPLFIATIISFVALALSFLFNWSPDRLAFWLPLLCSLPLAALSMMTVQLNSIQMTPLRMFLLDHTGIILNIVSFFSLMNEGMAIAILVGESAQHSWNIVARGLFMRLQEP